jgi:acyl-homoserine lactone acylase PvdQ
LSGDINLDYDDSIASLPISAAFALGLLTPYKSVYQEKSKKRYGNSGNSFVCAVEFGDKVKAKSLLAGNSSDPKSKHFNDQSEMYQKGNSKTCFYKEDVEKQSERKYHPGE